MRIYYDSFHEGVWFRDLHPSLKGATLHPFSGDVLPSAASRAVLAYDRPDIVLEDEGAPILVVERTVEVPSGHNPGQRFARLVASARNRVPVIYFGPYAAFKHGGKTAGPRYMNLRLFHALDQLSAIERAAVLAVRWPVDANYEVLQLPAKDDRMRAFMDLFFASYSVPGDYMNGAISESEFAREQRQEREAFIASEVTNPAQYDGPPASVAIGAIPDIPLLATANPTGLNTAEVVVYTIGMTYLRSDPYTGMAMLYAYLYCGGMVGRQRQLVLHFPEIDTGTWERTAARSPDAKHIRLYKLVADGVLFRNGYVPRERL